MAEETEEELELELAEAGVAFKAEMWATNFMMGYWKHLLAGLIVTLLAVLFFGQYQTYVQRSQRATASMIADVERELPGPVIQLSSMKSSGSPDVTDEKLCGAGDEIVAIADAKTGASSVEGYLKASELYRLCNESAKRRAVLEKAAEQSDSVLYHAAVAALANLDLEEEQGDQAVARLTDLRDNNSGFLAEQAAIDLGMALEHLGRHDEAQGVYADFLAKWPDSPRAELVSARQAPVATAGGGVEVPADPTEDEEPEEGEAG